MGSMILYNFLMIQEWQININVIKSSGVSDEDKMKSITRNSTRKALMDVSLKSWEGCDNVPAITSITEGYPFWWELKVEHVSKEGDYFGLLNRNK